MAGVERIVKMIRGNQMAPLSAASMEKGSYLRGYEHLTRFVFREFLFVFPLKEKMSKLNVLGYM